MHDLLIRNATLIDGTGADRRTADVAVNGDTITAVGRDLGVGRRTVEADGLLLTPGWVDIHTHYDGQATWDPYMTPSSYHGVTTAVFGNCGVGFAPVRRGSERYLINLMEGVEDIPESVLSEGLDFTWESFPDYLDTLAAMPRVMDVGAQMPHAALRFYVMGERGADHAETPTEAEIAEMGRLLEEALAAGALGFTTSRTVKHRAKDGRATPTLSAAEPELAGLALAMKRAGKGVIEVNSDFGAGDFAILRQAAELAGRPLSVLLLQVDNAPDLWRETLAEIEQANRDGLHVTGQVGSRFIGMMMGLETTVNPFASHPAWKAMAALAPRERYARLAADADLRRALWRDRPDNAHIRWIATALERTFPLGPDLNYEPAPADAVAAKARAAGRDPFDLALECMLAQDGKGLLIHPFENYTAGNLDNVRTMLSHPNCVAGLADAGAHVGVIADHSSATTLLTLWGRDRTRGERLPLEFLVRKQTLDTARAYGFTDRGVVAPGLRADLNLIDFDRLRVRPPEVLYDLPAGGKRLVQRADGYRHTFCAGVETLCDGEFTGALPGGLIRA
ncbi:MAG: amidohydrolase family protein [Alphaproteobacteria bacterium]|nr:amidohydrolase family protein [Alphaproteobacteria bacterium]MCB9930998.1 amidohydrolase family protein [Alphaproteobacteria bacterium]